ncbi:MAG: ThuA domain-containing protein [Planctomycetes bacterium]|nr:ThuA domain-containing protein [Planctomycetota bacterium]
MKRSSTSMVSALRRAGFALALVFVVGSFPANSYGQDEPAPSDTPASPKLPKLYFVTQSKGFVHPVVKRAERAMLAHAETCLTEMLAGRFEVVCRQDMSTFPEGFDDMSAIAFYTTGELPLDDTQRALFLRWIEKGGAFIGFHSATDTFYEWPEFGELIGGYFDGHPWHQKVRVRIEDPMHVVTAGLPQSFEITDEIYQFKNFDRERVHILASLDPESVDISKGKRDDGVYALAWCREYGRGRVFYTALGHRPEVWRDARFQRLTRRGVDWATRRWSDLLEGGLGGWHPVKGDETRWKLTGGVLEIAPSSSSLMTVAEFGDCLFELEFRFPEGTPEHGGDSGVVLQRHYEIQLRDGRGVGEEPTTVDCGALRGLVAPKVFAGKGPDVWQRLEVEFHAPRWDEKNAKTANARMTVRLNGVLVHDNVEISERTTDQRPESPGNNPIVLEDRGERVQFRNIRIRPLVP